jgi:hypothetical protein
MSMKENEKHHPKKSAFDLRSVFKNEKTLKTVIIGGITLVFILFLSATFSDISVPRGGDNNLQTGTTVGCEELRLEEKLKRAISVIDGVGEELTVVVTLDSLSETIYAERGSGVRTVITPRVRGVAIIAEGADSPIVQGRIVELVSRLLGINTTRISVTH